MKVTAEYNGVIIAEAEETEIVDRNHYFPPDSIKWDYFADSSHTTHCPFKGDASYYNLTVENQTGENLAWTYPSPKEEAKHIKDYVAFYPQVTVTTS